MEILGVGPLEIVFILLIALIVLGPKDMAKTGRTVGRFMYRVITSPGWRTFKQASKELRQLPTKLMREAGLEENELRQIGQEIGVKELSGQIGKIDYDLSSWTTPKPEGENLAAETPPAEPDETGDRAVDQAQTSQLPPQEPPAPDGSTESNLTQEEKLT
jgi:sec-independent protein translocase protein TatB